MIVLSIICLVLLYVRSVVKLFPKTQMMKLNPVGPHAMNVTACGDATVVATGIMEKLTTPKIATILIASIVMSMRPNAVKCAAIV